MPWLCLILHCLPTTWHTIKVQDIFAEKSMQSTNGCTGSKLYMWACHISCHLVQSGLCNIQIILDTDSVSHTTGYFSQMCAFQDGKNSFIHLLRELTITLCRRCPEPWLDLSPWINTPGVWNPNLLLTSGIRPCSYWCSVDVVVSEERVRCQRKI